MTDSWAMVRRDELWVRGLLREERRSEGEAFGDAAGITAASGIGDPKLRQTLRNDCDRALESVRAAIVPLRDARVRAIVTASTDGLESTVTVTAGGISIACTPEHVGQDHAALRHLLAPRPPARPPTHPLPIVWRNGSAAVLLHEAAGHAAEHGHHAAAWPAWLRVRDVAGRRSADLLAGQPPAATRRESFRHVPLERMTAVVATQEGAPFELPDDRIEVHLVAGGAYEPLSEEVRIDVAIADRVRGVSTQRIPPFSLRLSRRAIAASLLGAEGDPIRYPGVICSREGQELFVASHAPVMITAEPAA